MHSRRGVCAQLSGSVYTVARVKRAIRRACLGCGPPFRRGVVHLLVYAISGHQGSAVGRKYASRDVGSNLRELVHNGVTPLAGVREMYGCVTSAKRLRFSRVLCPSCERVSRFFKFHDQSPDLSGDGHSQPPICSE